MAQGWARSPQYLMFLEAQQRSRLISIPGTTWTLALGDSRSLSLSLITLTTEITVTHWTLYRPVLALSTSMPGFISPSASSRRFHKVRWVHRNRQLWTHTPTPWLHSFLKSITTSRSPWLWVRMSSRPTAATRSSTNFRLTNTPTTLRQTTF